jgi:hypothetical protein
MSDLDILPGGGVCELARNRLSSLPDDVDRAPRGGEAIGTLP